MSGPKQQNITHYRGGHFSRTERLVGIATSQCADAWITIRKRLPDVDLIDDSDAEVVAQGTLTGGEIVMVDLEKFSIDLPQLGAGFDQLSYRWDFKVKDLSGKIWPLTYGIFSLTVNVGLAT